MILTISAKTSDMLNLSFGDGVHDLFSYQGYTPEFLQDESLGEDYIFLDIDIETGKIINWKFPTEGELKKFFIDKGANNN